MKPPKRERRTRIINGSIEDGTIAYGVKWTLHEKKQLLDGLKSCGPDNLESIQRDFLPARQMIDIKNFITNLKHRYRDIKPKKPVSRAPIEVWLDEAEQLTKREHDYSFILADIFSVFGNLEPHDNLPHIHAPDWGEIYLFLAALLRGGLPPELSPMNATIVLSLFDELAENLRQMDTKTQRLLMRRKFAILSQTAKASIRAAAYRWAQTALENDPFERVPQMQSDHEPGSMVADTEPSTSVASAVAPTYVKQSAEPVAKSSQNKERTLTPSQDSDITYQASDVVQTKNNQTDKGLCPVAEQTGGKNGDNCNSPNGQCQTSAQPNEVVDNSANETPPTESTRTSANKKGPETIQSKRSSLYTLNPFCIPVKYLSMSSVSKT